VLVLCLTSEHFLKGAILADDHVLSSIRLSRDLIDIPDMIFIYVSGEPPLLVKSPWKWGGPIYKITFDTNMMTVVSVGRSPPKDSPEHRDCLELQKILSNAVSKRRGKSAAAKNRIF